jgi:hypothetical protein
MFHRKEFLGLLLVLSLFGCQSSLQPKDYYTYYQKHFKRYSKAIERNGVLVTVNYMPCEVYASMDMQSDKALSSKDAMKRYDNSLFFLVSINQLDSLPVSDEIRNRFITAAYTLEKPFVLASGADSVRLSVCVADNKSMQMQGTSFVLAFPRKNCKKSLNTYTLLLRDLSPELGTIKIKLKEITHRAPGIRG